MGYNVSQTSWCMFRLIAINLNSFRVMIGKLATVADVDDACLAVGEVVSLLKKK